MSLNIFYLNDIPRKSKEQNSKTAKCTSCIKIGKNLRAFIRSIKSKPIKPCSEPNDGHN